MGWKSVENRLWTAREFKLRIYSLLSEIGKFALKSEICRKIGVFEMGKSDFGLSCS